MNEHKDTHRDREREEFYSNFRHIYKRDISILHD